MSLKKTYLDSGVLIAAFQGIQAIEEKDFFALAGLWENRNITTESLRQKVWRKNTQ